MADAHVHNGHCGCLHAAQTESKERSLVADDLSGICSCLCGHSAVLTCLGEPFAGWPCMPSTQHAATCGASEASIVAQCSEVRLLTQFIRRRRALAQQTESLKPSKRKLKLNLK